MTAQMPEKLRYEGKKYVKMTPEPREAEDVPPPRLHLDSEKSQKHHTSLSNHDRIKSITINGYR